MLRQCSSVLMGVMHAPMASSAGASFGLQQSYRAMSVTRQLIQNLLKSSEISHLLHEGGVDFRDCFEKGELSDRLASYHGSLPASVQQRLHSLLFSRRQQASAARAPACSPDASAGGTPEGAAVSEAHKQHDTAQAMSSVAAAAAAAVQEPAPLPEGMEGLFEDEQRSVRLYQRCRPSVVHIACSSRRLRQASQGGLLLDPNVPTNFGSGFIWDDQGHVITNFHVIRDAESIQVTLSNNKKFKASIKGTEPDKDLAVLKIEAPASDLVPVGLGVSSRLVVGQKVYAIGNPFGLDHTLTAGIVSGLGRQMQSITGHVIRDVVQTDAAINPGNSGGPLLCSRGNLVGVNTAATSHPLTTAGFGFAIPVDTVRRIVNQLIRYGRVVRPSLGVYCLHDLHSRQLLGNAEGVVVEGVSPGSGAAQAGLRGVVRDEYGNIRLGDVIVGVGGQPISGVEELVACVERFALGDQVPITVHRYSLEAGQQRAEPIKLQLVVPLLHEAGPRR